MTYRQPLSVAGVKVNGYFVGRFCADVVVPAAFRNGCPLNVTTVVKGMATNENAEPRMIALCDAAEGASLRIEGFLFSCTGNRVVCLGGFGEYRVKPWLASVRQMTTVFATPDELLVSVGTDLGSSEWVTIEQARIDGFADATGDHQWIHIDPAAAAAGPFGATIAHGYLTLALTNQFLPEIVRVDGVSMGINYGVNRVRFPQPVAVGSRVRGHATLTSAEEIGGGVQAVITITVEIEGGAKPACVVESVSRFLR